MVFNFRRKETMTSTSQLPILQVDALRKTYRKLVAVRDISFAVYPQQVFCLVGPNGAGKTSVIDCIVGLKKPDGGDVHLFGERVSNLQRRNDIRSRIGIQLFRNFTLCFCPYFGRVCVYISPVGLCKYYYFYSITITYL